MVRSAYSCIPPTYTQNGYGQDYEAFWRDLIEKLVGDYVNRHPRQPASATMLC
jgi:hypothetical protein